MLKRVVFVIVVLLVILLPMLGIGSDIVFAGPGECSANGVGWGCGRGGGQRETVRDHACRRSQAKPGC